MPANRPIPMTSYLAHTTAGHSDQDKNSQLPQEVAIVADTLVRLQEKAK